MSAFWQEHQVGGPYYSLEESGEALVERARLYPDLTDLMPVHFPGKSILDYGCGPGHDTLLFLFNGAKHVTFADVSWQALSTTSMRVSLHGLSAQTTAFLIGTGQLPQVEHIHCAGVLHHVEDPSSVLQDLREALVEGGEARVMIYDGDISKHTQSEVPITRWWTKAEFYDLAFAAGFDAEWVGSYPCSAEWRPDCHAACFRLY